MTMSIEMPLIYILSLVALISVIVMVCSSKKAKNGEKSSDKNSKDADNSENGLALLGVIVNSAFVVLGIAVLLWGVIAGYDFWGNDFSWDIWPPETAVDYHSLACIILTVPFFFTIFAYGISGGAKAGRREGSRYYTVYDNGFGGYTATNAGNASGGGCLGAVAGLILAVVLFVTFAQLALAIFTLIRGIKLIFAIRALAYVKKTSAQKTKKFELSLKDRILDENYTELLEIVDENGEEWECQKLDVLYHGDNAYGLLLPVKVPEKLKDTVPTDGLRPMLVKLSTLDDRIFIINQDNAEFDALNELYTKLYL